VAFWDTYWQTVNQNGAEWTVDLEARAVRHTLGCLMARVRGRSPLEYMDDVARTRQARAVNAIIAQPPVTVAELAAAFVAGIEEQHG
jgi:hypothetical protein